MAKLSLPFGLERNNGEAVTEASEIDVVKNGQKYALDTFLGEPLIQNLVLPESSSIVADKTNGYYNITGSIYVTYNFKGGALDPNKSYKVDITGSGFPSDYNLLSISYYNGAFSANLSASGKSISIKFYTSNSKLELSTSGVRINAIIEDNIEYKVFGCEPTPVKVVDNLTTDSSIAALSAKQGKELNNKLSNLVKDNLTTDSSTNALSAKQGKVLNEKIEDSMNLTSTGSGIGYSENYAQASSTGSGSYKWKGSAFSMSSEYKMILLSGVTLTGTWNTSQRQLYFKKTYSDGSYIYCAFGTDGYYSCGQNGSQWLIVDSILFTGFNIDGVDYPIKEKGILTRLTNAEEKIPTVVDNLTTDDSSKALSAKQGKELKSQIDSIEVVADAGVGCKEMTPEELAKLFDERFVDLGLPSGILWASRNLGASTDGQSDYGDMFAWGELTQKSDARNYTAANYKYGSSSMTKYNSTDNKTVLDVDDDAAVKNTGWGHGWRIPTSSEFQELIDNCTWTAVKISGSSYYYGYTVTGPNGKTIFLPLSGSVDTNYEDGYHTHSTDYARYWTSNLGENKIAAVSFELARSTTPYSFKEDYRYIGKSIRPVMKKKLLIDPSCAGSMGSVSTTDNIYRKNSEGNLVPVEETLTDLALKVRDVAAVSTLPSDGALASGKTYGSPTQPITGATVINGRNVTTESIVYFKPSADLDIQYNYKLNDAPETTETKTCVVSFENGVAVFGVLEEYTLSSGQEVD